MVHPLQIYFLTLQMQFFFYFDYRNWKQLEYRWAFYFLNNNDSFLQSNSGERKQNYKRFCRTKIVIDVASGNKNSHFFSGWLLSCFPFFLFLIHTYYFSLVIYCTFFLSFLSLEQEGKRRKCCSALSNCRYLEVRLR